MKKRKQLSRRRSKKQFSNRAAFANPVNDIKGVQRGGIRL